MSKTIAEAKAKDKQYRKTGQDYELKMAVFEVRGSKAWDGEHEQTYCQMCYVRLEAGLSAGAVIIPLQRELAARHKVPLADVMFRFWCDTYQAYGGSPKVFAWDANKLNAVEVR